MNEKKNTSSEITSETLPAAGTSAGASGVSVVSLAPEAASVRRLGRGNTCLSESAQTMSALNRLPLSEKAAAVKAGRITAADALAGSDELAGEAGRLLHAVAVRPLEIPERRTPAFFPRKRLSRIIKRADLLGRCPPAKPFVESERCEVKMLDARERTHATPWAEVEFGMTKTEAWHESKRCMRCYRLIALTTRDPVPETQATDDKTAAL